MALNMLPYIRILYVENTSLTLLNFLILFSFLGFVTVMGHKLSGGIKSRKDFFNAGGGLPWWAVSTSIIATVVSSVTFISVPTAVFKDGGNLFYVQILLGLMIAKVLTAWVMARPIHESHSCNTIFDYIGKRTDAKIGNFSMILGLCLTSLNTAVRLLTTALVLSVVSGFSLFICTIVVVLFAILWSWIAGLKTVIWTDFLLFIIFTLGALFCVFWISNSIEMSFSDAWSHLGERGKLALFDFSVNPTRTYTIWAGLIGVTLGNFALSGTQATFQRIKACRSVKDAQKAFSFSALLYLTPICMLLVGLALSVFYHENPLPQEFLASLEKQPDRIFPYFIATELPNGISGIFIAAIFAAGISTIDTHLTEVSDITVSDIYEKHVKSDAGESHYILIARLALLFWGAIFVGLAMFLSLFQGEGLLDLMFKVPNYVTGVILATVFLARFSIGSTRGYIIGAILGFITVLILQHLKVGFFYWPFISGLVMFTVTWLLSDKSYELSGVIK
jgi:SSS family transporter